MIKLTADRFEGISFPQHDDMLGRLETALSGASQWNVANINDTLFPLGWLRNNSNDFATMRIQSPHWRKQDTALDSIHLHYVLQTAYTANQTILFNTFWTWIQPGSPVPALTAWNNTPSTLSMTGNQPAWYYGLHTLVTSPPPASPDGYGLYLLVRVLRGNGTYTGELGILDVDAHAQKDRLGSIYEYSDS